MISSSNITLILSGLGLAMLKVLVARDNITLIAGVRDLNAESSKALLSLPTGKSSSVILVKIEAVSQASIKAAVKTLTEERNIEKIDVLIANAGIANYYGDATITPLEEVREHFEVNVIGTLSLFQETWPLLQKSEKPVFMALSVSDWRDSHPIYISAYVLIETDWCGFYW
jgi:norsolorinic acid ketoreductase